MPVRSRDTYSLMEGRGSPPPDPLDPSPSVAPTLPQPRPAAPAAPACRPPARGLALGLALALPLGLLGACDSGTAKPAGAEAAESSGARRKEAPKVIVAEVVRREMVRYLETTTTLESEREIPIHSEVSGRVVAIEVEEGDLVEAEAVLCTLEDVDERLALEDARVAREEARNAAEQATLAIEEARARATSTQLAYDQARRDHERDQRLFEGSDVASSVSEQALESSRLAMETAKSDHATARIALDKAKLAATAAEIAAERMGVAYDQARRALDQRTITAPFGGVIATRMVRLGQSVGPADPLFVLTDTTRVRAVFFRAQEELALFAPHRVSGGPGDGTRPAGGASNGSNGAGGSRAALTFEATTEALPGMTFTGRVQRVSPTIDATSGQFRVTAIFDAEANGRLLPGMLTRLRIATDAHPDALVVPKRSVRREGEQAFLFVVEEDDTLRRVTVVEGYGDDDHTEVTPLVATTLDGGPSLEVGMRVVTVGSRDLEEGDSVAVEGDEPEPAPELEEAGQEETGAEALLPDHEPEAAEGPDSSGSPQPSDD